MEDIVILLIGFASEDATTQDMEDIIVCFVHKWWVFISTEFILSCAQFQCLSYNEEIWRYQV